MKNAMLNNPVLQPGYWVPNNINEFFFYDDTFTIDRQRVFDICNAMATHDLDLSWAYQ